MTLLFYPIQLKCRTIFIECSHTSVSLKLLGVRWRRQFTSSAAVRVCINFPYWRIRSVLRECQVTRDCVSRSFFLAFVSLIPLIYKCSIPMSVIICHVLRVLFLTII